MIRGLISRLIAAPLIALILSGGGGLPVLDGLIFHSREYGPEAQRPHYEATSGHHADGCAVSSTAHQARFAPTVGPDLEIVAFPPQRGVVRALPLLCAKPLPGQLHSRSPPLPG